MTENQTLHEVTIPGPAAVKLRDTVAALTRTKGFKGKIGRRQPRVLKYVKLTPQTFGDEGMKTARFEGSDQYMAFRLNTLATGSGEDWLLHAVTLEKALKILTAQDVKKGHCVTLSWRTNDGEKGAAKLLTASVIDSHGATVRFTSFSTTPPGEEWAVLTVGLAKELLGIEYPKLPFPKNENWREEYGAARVTQSGDMLLAMSRIMGEDFKDSVLGFHLTRQQETKEIFGQTVVTPATGAHVIEIDSDEYTLLALFMGSRTDR